MDNARLLSLAAGLGVVAGLRTFSAPLTLSRAVRVHSLDLAGTPFAPLGTSRGAHIVAALALGELIADKTPSIPSRTDTASLGARFASGAIAGAAIGKARNGRWLAAALIGGAAAIGSSFAGYELRRRAVKATRLPDFAVALIEDAFVIGSGLALVSAMRK